MTTRVFLSVGGYLVLLLFLPAFSQSEPPKRSASELLRDGIDAMSSGKTSEAVSFFSTLIDLDPTNLRGHLKRGEAYYVSKQYAMALHDFEAASKIIQQSPASTLSEEANALYWQARALLLLGRFDESVSKASEVLKMKPKHSSAKTLLSKAMGLRSRTERARALCKSLETVGSGLSLYQSILSETREALDLRFESVRCALRSPEERSNAMKELNAILLKHPSNADAMYKVAQFFVLQGAFGKGQEWVRDCLRSNMDHEGCKSMNVILRAATRDVDKALELLDEKKGQEALRKIVSVQQRIEKAKGKEESDGKDGDETEILRPLLTRVHVAFCIVSGESMLETEKGFESCNAALEKEGDLDGVKGEKLLRVLNARGKICMKNKMYRDAVADFSRLVKESEQQGNKEMVKRGKCNEQKAMAASALGPEGNHYELLGVPRGAGKKDIQRAYRKLVPQYHPDRFPDPEEKKEAQQKFMLINSARDTLIDESKRGEYDQQLAQLEHHLKQSEEECMRQMPEQQHPFGGGGGGGGNPFGGDDFFRSFFQGGGGGGSGGGQRFSFHFG
eukprot:TRINITY_DN8_c0_g1_i2.p1 TRINITY_DN8_c0_g1~~TRINITY_DN8_c0_g1_i2.p1  ORF type:complete len:562 (-),score=184.38 TRINITY_DN8_c0_g1_i2:57-1742(-)